MIEKKISNEELEKVSYSRLATNPGARTSRGESAMSGEKLKERMDEPFKLFQQKFNALVALVGGDEKGDSLIKHIPTGIGENHTLADMISDVISESAEFASYLSVGELTLLEKLVQIDKVLKGHDSHIADRVNPHGVTAKQLGLERVDNTSDEEKPLSAAVRAAFAALGGELSAAEAELIDRIAQALISAKFYADDTKVGKVGDQVINGRLSISGDLLVEGDTFAKQIESLEVGDAVIIANADGVLLAELSGYVIRVNGDSAYAIVYDPADDCVKIGLGVYDGESKLFTFGEGEAQVLATRGVISDGHVPVWNDEKKIFEDSGKTADKVVERGADIPNGEIPVLKDGKLIGSGKTASSFASKDSAQVVANALKGSASGEIVALKDVSPLEHNIGVRVSSKNLIPYPYSNTTKTVNGITFTDNGDGSITISGTATGFAYFILQNDANYGSGNINGSTTITNGSYAASKYLFYNASNKALSINIESGTTVNETIYPQVEKGTTATAYTPFVPDVGAVKVKAQGVNIIDITEMLNNQLVDNGDGTYTLTKNGSDGLRFSYACKVNIPIGVYIKITNEIIDYNVDSDKIHSFGIQFVDADNNGSTISFFPEERGSSKYFLTNQSKITIYVDSAASNGSYVRFKNFQIEYGKVGSEYEPYIEPVEYAVNADGTVEGVKSIYPATTLTTDTKGVLIEVEYNRNINDAFAELKQAIILLGGII